MSIKHFLLALLQEQPLNASGLRSSFEAATASVWPLNMGQVAQTLDRLERDGLIRVVGTTLGANGRATATYELTHDGHAALNTWWISPATKPETTRDELVIKVNLATTTRAPHILDILDGQRLAIMEELRKWNRRLSDTSSGIAADRLIVERRIFDLESESRWLDRVESLYRDENKRRTNS